MRDAHEATLAAACGARVSDLTRRAQRVDLSLHDVLAAGLADNRMLAEAYATNRDRIAIIQNTRSFLADRIVSAMEEHLVILGALERGDAQAAVAAIREHYRQTLRWLRWRGARSSGRGGGSARLRHGAAKAEAR